MKKEKKQKIRVRFAPSPTGPLHIGGARTALFNFLFAKKYQGRFILRIEDTDRERSKPEFEKDLLENLQWLGIQWDEGIDPLYKKEYLGNYGPYRQSERSEIYKRYIEKLLAEEKAYYCFCTPEELRNMREYQILAGQPPRYSGKCRQLSRGEVEKKLKAGIPAIVRLKVFSKKIKFKDLIRQNLEFDANLIGDFSLAKKRGEEFLPLYNFAAVVDDFEMKISHVIRGEDHLSNTPKQILLQEALGFPHPNYAHLPLILGPDKSKLSKRHGTVSVTSYREAGYLPEALINFVAFLGWNPGTEREIFSLPSLIKEFSLERVQKAGAIFNIKKLDFLNGFYIRQKPPDKLTELCLPYLIKAKLIEELANTSNYTKEMEPEVIRLFKGGKLQFKIKETGEIIDFHSLRKIISLYQERLKKLSEIPDLVDFFFKEKLDYQKDLLIWKTMRAKEVKKILKKAGKILGKVKTQEWSKENLEKILILEAERVGDRGKLLWPLRVALTGKKASAPPFEILEILGKEKSLKRIREAITKL